jgi:predicted nucleotidyltransferase
MDQVIQTELDILKDIIIHTVPVVFIYLFGSYAYGVPNKDSDLDLYVVLKDNVQMRNIDAAMKIRFAIDRKKSMPVDLIVQKKSVYLDNLQAASIERQIAKEGLKIYG